MTQMQIDSPNPVLVASQDYVRNLLLERVEAVEYWVEDRTTWVESEVEVLRALVIEFSQTVRDMIVAHTTGDEDHTDTCGGEWPCPTVTRLFLMITKPDGQFTPARSDADDQS
ncbi:hypothetical protein [Actinokineospora sp. NBRC 105648]|uniref:hypothetical protein n=1 Tax=Actinokineospora sp. NBRC 105648 TaxID=3032206 RepID=UPI0024A27FE1|nr:hypothetical protein [Actinokineospora sp. NBRC 105648]GLZ37673.1 hypothetical protein Acsp05_12980 [Actinokineospora sp. NBRC 105648]